MRNRRNTRNKNKIKEILSNKNFWIISVILLAIIASSIGIISYRKYQDKIMFAQQKEELEKQTDKIFTSLEESATNPGNSQDTSAKISIVGDILCGKDMLEDAKVSDSYDFSNMFKDVLSYTQNADMAVGTLETNFTNGEYLGTGKYNSPISFLSALKDTGIDMVSLAHNHELDYGANGYNDTIKAIRDNNLSITGIKNNIENNDSEFTGNIKSVRGIKVAFLAYTYGLSNESELTQEEKANANIYSEEQAKKDIDYAKKNSDYIIVIMHWGDVNNSNISQWQENVKNYLVDNGVDMILGSHPSVIEPMEVVTNKNGQNVLIAYSLGNYISSLKYDNADVELILNVQIIKRADDEKAYLKKVDYTPVFVVDNGKDSDNRFQLENMKDLAIDYANGNTEKITREVYDKLLNKLDWLNNLIANK